MPGMAMLAGSALSMLFTDAQYARWMRVGFAALFIGLGSLTLYDEWSLHPFEYVYFNRISGGLPRQARRFETDYWGATYREGFEWVAQNIHSKRRRPVQVAACGGNDQLKYYGKEWNLKNRFAVAKNTEQAEIYLAFTRTPCGNAEGEVLHTVERQGVRLLSVLRRKPHPVQR
jgi:hypothetical protein